MVNVRDDERKHRLAAALRENLKRRKQQAKGRAGAPRDDARAEPGSDKDPEEHRDGRVEHPAKHPR